MKYFMLFLPDDGLRRGSLRSLPAAGSGEEWEACGWQAPASGDRMNSRTASQERAWVTFLAFEAQRLSF